MKNIVLVGFMGTGKTEVGRQLADMLQWPLVDTDDLIMVAAGKSIPEIFAQDGEAAFRTLESTVLRDLAEKATGPMIVSAGGGIVLADVNWPWLRRLGHVVCLTAEPQEILQRVGKDENRPLLQGPVEEALDRIQRLLAKRREAYAKADWACATDGLAPAEVAARILRRFAGGDS